MFSEPLGFVWFGVFLSLCSLLSPLDGPREMLNFSFFFALLWLNFIWMKQDFSCNLQGFKSALQDPTSFLTMRPCWKNNTTALFLVSDRNCALQACSSFPLRRSCPRTASLSPLRCDPKLQQEPSPIHGSGSVQTPPQTPQQQAGSAQSPGSVALQLSRAVSLPGAEQRPGWLRKERRAREGRSHPELPQGSGAAETQLRAIVWHLKAALSYPYNIFIFIIFFNVIFMCFI